MGSVYVTAPDPSGDVFAGEVMDALKRKDQSLSFRGVGGAAISCRAEGPDIDMEAVNVLGFWEGLSAYAKVREVSAQIAADIAASKPDVAVLVDAWGLSLRIAKKLRRLAPDIPIIKLIGPQVWATRAGRAKTLAASVDHLICLNAFEAPYYAPYGLPVTIMGHPALSRPDLTGGQRTQTSPSKAPQDGEDTDTDTLLLLPGSRPAEIRRMAPPMIAAAKALRKLRPDMQICLAPADNVYQLFCDLHPDLPEDWTLIRGTEARFQAMAKARLAISCSGTVNMELALSQAPIITGYRLSPLTYAALKTFLFRADYITLLNMAAGEEIIPELLQSAFRPDRIVETALPLWDAGELRRSQIEAQNRALKTLGLGARPAHDIAADTILTYLRKRSGTP